MNHKNAMEKGKTYFEGDYNCAQSVLVALESVSGLDQLQSEALTAGFGGGMGMHQEICGAVSGASMAISHAIFNKYEDHTQGKEAAYNAVQTIMTKFKEDMKHVRCSDLTQCDFSDESQKANFVESGVKANICVPAVTLAIQLAMELIEHEEHLSK